MDMVRDPSAASCDAAARWEREAPPKVPLTFALGVTGHRPDLIGGQRERIDRCLGELFDEMAAVVDRLGQDHAPMFAHRAPSLHLVSPLAEGADQIAAEVALRRHFTLGAMLPFARDQYERDFTDPAARGRFRALLGQARTVLELPGERSAPLAAYVMAGRATIAHCDVLIAVWDGQPPRGRGGTGEIVEIALLEGTPIIHVPVDPAAPLRLMWSGLDPRVCTKRQNAHAAAVPYSGEALAQIIGALLLPPADPRERGYILDYYGERERPVHFRLEYPLLLSLTGVSPMRRADVRARPLQASLASEWEAFRGACDDCHGVKTAIDPLQRAYCWSDRLARHFAQTYRSGHIFNFVVGAGAVLVALAGLVLPQGKLVLAATELAMIVAVIVNTHVGTRHCWHRRWLDYRQVAERLRPMRSLKLLGVAAPLVDPHAHVDERRWSEWYAAGIWRAMGCPSGTMRAPRQLAAALTEHELAPQIAYHRHAAHVAETLDHRLHLVGLTLFLAGITGCLVLILGYFLAPDWVAAHSKWFVVLSAGLPAVGTAIFGIRVQGDFAGTAQRSLSTAARLEASVAEASRATELTRAADLFEEAARAMLVDLGEWQLSHQQRELVIPG